MTRKILTRNIAISIKKIKGFCREHHIKRLLVFGSALTEDFKEDSDIDIIVEFEKGHVPGFAFIDIQEELSSILNRSVDLETQASLSKYFRDEVLEHAEVIYAEE